jgi:glycosyltransferase involved in cell wall biosynthesis
MKKTVKSDGLVLLSEQMLDFVENKTIKHIVMEGLVDIQSMDVKDSYDMPEHRVILYTGTLRKIFGVLNLVEAFMQIHHKNVELWICGSGDSSQKICEAAEKDSRIKFWGLVDNQKSLEFQKRATILVNPRTSDGEYTKYSFPSKTIEYLLAGKSVVINKLPGIPEEYYDFVHTPEDESVMALRNCIISVLDTDKYKLQSKALAGRDFVMKNKNSKTQMERIMKMIQNY